MKTYTEKQLTEEMHEVLALAIYLDVEPDEITYEGNDRFTYGDEEYLVCDDATADMYWDESLDNYIDECILPELDDRYRMYFDDKKWKRDARIDGRGHSLNYYDGSEEVEHIDGVDYYIFRQN